MRFSPSRLSAAIPPTNPEAAGELLQKGCSVHENYTSCVDFITQLRQEWANTIVDTQSFLVSLKEEQMAKTFSFKYLADILPKVVQKQL